VGCVCVCICVCVCVFEGVIFGGKKIDQSLW
jgi:hypothetical protein